MEPYHRATDLIRKIHNDNFPYLMVSYVHDPDIYYVGTDHEYGSFIATEHLIKLGDEKLGYLSGERGNPLGDLREKGFKRALQKYGRTFREDFIFHLRLAGEWNYYQAGYEIGQQVTRLTDRPDGILAYNDLSALGFEQAVLAYGSEVPEDIAIIGFDDIERDLDAPVPLTSVHQPTTRVGTIAVQKLVNRIEGSEIDTRILLKPRIVIRKSCGAKKGYISSQVKVQNLTH